MKIPRPRVRLAFTLVELLVVIAIIASGNFLIHLHLKQ